MQNKKTDFSSKYFLVKKMNISNMQHSRAAHTPIIKKMNNQAVYNV